MPIKINPRRTPVKARFKASQHTDLKVKVVLHATQAALDKVAGDHVWGYCTCWAPEDGKRTVAIIHLCQTNLIISVIAHEAYHATTTVVSNSHLVGDSTYVDEITADTLENIVNQIIKIAQEHKIPLVLVEPA